MTTKDGKFIHHFEPPGRTQHRLIIAMGVATCMMAILFASLDALLDFESGTPSGISAQEQSLTVQLRQREPDSKPDNDLREQDEVLPIPKDVAVVETPATTEVAVSVITPEPRFDSPKARDWRRIITESVAETGIEKATQEASRSAMWRQSYSVMFQPDDEQVIEEQDPIIPDFRFKPQIHVAGLGITIGSCFIGIPLVGVPVEDRTAAISLWVCADG